MRPIEAHDNFNSVDQPSDRRVMRQVLAVGCVLSGILTTIFLNSGPFEYGSPAKKPIAWMTRLFFLATLLSIWAVVPATRIERSKRSLVWLIVMFGLNQSDGSVETARHLNKKEGPSGFLTQWRMNDVVFSAIYHNARPDSDGNLDQPWYVFVPNNARGTWLQRLLRIGGAGTNPAFLTARIPTTTMYMAAYLAIILRIRKSDDLTSLLNNCFLIIAIFFFLQPTQNPWYWLWAIPLACFADNRGWQMVPAFLLCYYLRFWFKTLAGEFCLGSFCYSGTGLFDHCIVWFEFGAIFAVIIGFRISKCRRISVRNPQV